ncbi:UV radiation resistance associated protein [Lingula anatina]|uniref:UV radiation resistance associated protein n=1 Tax=Lingula anatina TaxID=7574 RepID=A0A1S3JZB4_LINAN|nr:UV radiation resistance associated protein [Lingula anatina]|eukprot:XP_013415627.1 UV radiation resistance associated protein [Lingula anatina]
MEARGARLDRRHFTLTTHQRRLRHLKSIAARNLMVPNVSELDVASLQTYFTLHTKTQEPAFYTSEKIRGSLNPSWRGFLLTHLTEEVDTTSTSVIVKVWISEEGKSPHVLLQWDVHFSGLVYIADKIQKDGRKYKGNTLVFGMFDAYFGPTEELQKPKQQSLTSEFMKVDHSSVRSSYTISSLSRIVTILRAIKQTQASVKKVRGCIEDTLVSSLTRSKKLSEREVLILHVNQMRSELESRTMQLQAEKETYERLQTHNHQRDVSVQTKFEAMKNDKDRLKEKRKIYFEMREQYLKANAQLIMRKKQLIADLAFYIYPLREEKNGIFTIGKVRLPNSEDFQGQDETMIAVALGATAHMVQMIAQFLDIPLRYAIDHRCSKSKIRDHITPKLPDKERDFPLYGKGKDKFQFNYAVYLLNKNIAQLRYYCGLGTTDLRLTLPNLQSLLELRLGVKLDQPGTIDMSQKLRIPMDSRLVSRQGSVQSFSSMGSTRDSSVNFAYTQEFEDILAEEKGKHSGREVPRKDMQQSVSRQHSVVFSDLKGQRSHSLSPDRLGVNRAVIPGQDNLRVSGSQAAKSKRILDESSSQEVSRDDSVSRSDPESDLKDVSHLELRGSGILPTTLATGKLEDIDAGSSNDENPHSEYESEFKQWQKRLSNDEPCEITSHSGASCEKEASQLVETSGVGNRKSLSGQTVVNADDTKIKQNGNVGMVAVDNNIPPNSNFSAQVSEDSESQTKRAFQNFQIPQNCDTHLQMQSDYNISNGAAQNNSLKMAANSTVEGAVMYAEDTMTAMENDIITQRTLRLESGSRSFRWQPPSSE